MSDKQRKDTEQPTIDPEEEEKRRNTSVEIEENEAVPRDPKLPLAEDEEEEEKSLSHGAFGENMGNYTVSPVTSAVVSPVVKDDGGRQKTIPAEGKEASFLQLNLDNLKSGRSIRHTTGT